MTVLRGLVPTAKVQAKLRERADSYGRDAEACTAEDEMWVAAMYRTIRDELRKVADELEPNLTGAAEEQAR